MKEIIIVSGARDSGKTTKMWKLYNELKKDNSNRIGGYIMELEGSGNEKLSYTLSSLNGGESLLLIKSEDYLQPDSDISWLRYGRRFLFSGDSFEKATKQYKSIVSKSSHIFLDEAGPLERDGKGFADVLFYLEENFKGTLIISVRDTYLDKIIDRYRFVNYSIY